jgi:hypothetical protein
MAVHCDNDARRHETTVPARFTRRGSEGYPRISRLLDAETVLQRTQELALSGLDRP